MTEIVEEHRNRIRKRSTGRSTSQEKKEMAAIRRCTTILKSGARKGQECGCPVKHVVSGVGYCGRHYKPRSQVIPESSVERRGPLRIYQELSQEDIIWRKGHSLYDQDFVEAAKFTRYQLVKHQINTFKLINHLFVKKVFTQPMGTHLCNKMGNDIFLKGFFPSFNDTREPDFFNGKYFVFTTSSRLPNGSFSNNELLIIDGITMEIKFWIPCESQSGSYAISYASRDKIILMKSVANALTRLVISDNSDDFNKSEKESKHYYISLENDRAEVIKSLGSIISRGIFEYYHEDKILRHIFTRQEIKFSFPLGFDMVKEVSDDGRAIVFAGWEYLELHPKRVLCLQIDGTVVTKFKYRSRVMYMGGCYLVTDKEVIYCHTGQRIKLNGYEPTFFRKCYACRNNTLQEICAGVIIKNHLDSSVIPKIIRERFSLK